MCLTLLLRTPGAAAAPPQVASLQRLTEAEWGAYHEVDHQGPGTYAFGYDVEDPETGNTQFRQEERHPNGTVTGSYGLVLPDGSVQIVHYTADHLGYRARIETKPASQRANLRPPAPSPPVLAAPPPQVRPAFAAPPSPVRVYAGPPLPVGPPAASPARFAQGPPVAYQPVFWLPASAAQPPAFSANYV